MAKKYDSTKINPDYFNSIINNPLHVDENITDNETIKEEVKKESSRNDNPTKKKDDKKNKITDEIKLLLKYDPDKFKGDRKPITFYINSKFEDIIEKIRVHGRHDKKGHTLEYVIIKYLQTLNEERLLKLFEEIDNEKW